MGKVSGEEGDPNTDFVPLAYVAMGVVPTEERTTWLKGILSTVAVGQHNLDPQRPAIKTEPGAAGREEGSGKRREGVGVEGGQGGRREEELRGSG